MPLAPHSTNPSCMRTLLAPLWIVTGCHGSGCKLGQRLELLTTSDGGAMRLTSGLASALALCMTCNMLSHLSRLGGLQVLHQSLQRILTRLQPPGPVRPLPLVSSRPSSRTCQQQRHSALSTGSRNRFPAPHALPTDLAMQAATASQVARLPSASAAAPRCAIYVDRAATVFGLAMASATAEFGPFA